MLSSELYDIVDRYVNRHITLEELEDWLVARFPLFFRLPYSSDTEFVADIEMGLDEMSDKTLTEEAFRTLLKNLLEQQRVVWASYPAKGEDTYAESGNEPSPILQYVSQELAHS